MRATSRTTVIAPAALLALSCLSLNVGRLFGHYFVDLSAPASIALLYFSLAKLYNSHLRQYWAGEQLYRRPSAGVGMRWRAMLSAEFGAARASGRGLSKLLADVVAALGGEAADADAPSNLRPQAQRIAAYR